MSRAAAAGKDDAMYLTRRQKEVLDFVSDHVGRHGYAPTLQEIGEHFGLSSPATVYKHVEQLVRKGYLRKSAHQERGIQLVDPEPVRTVEVPVLGQVMAGRAIEAIVEPDTVNLPPELVGDKATYALRVRGNSLIDEHIRDRDLLIVEDRQRPGNGETVVALLGGERATIKRFYRDGPLVRLQPSNPTIEPRFVADADLRIHGIVVGLVRDYR